MVFATKFAHFMAMTELILSIITLIGHLAIPTPGSWTIPLTIATAVTIATSGLGMCAIQRLQFSPIAFYLFVEIVRFLFYVLFAALAYPEPLFPWMGIYSVLVILMVATVLATLVQMLLLAVILATDWNEDWIEYYDDDDYYPYGDEAYYPSYYYSAYEDEEDNAANDGDVDLPPIAPARKKGKSKKKATKEEDDDDIEPLVEGEMPPTRSKTCLPKRFQEPTFPDDIEGVSDEIRKIWARDMEKTAVFKDLCRLARRFELCSNGKPISLNLDESCTDTQVLAAIIDSIADHVESDDEQKAVISTAVAKWADKKKTDNLEQLIEKCFVEEIGTTSATAQVLRGVHQGTVMPVTAFLRKKTRVLSKDVSSADGWKIEVDFIAKKKSKTSWKIKVAHLRKEQSLVASGNEHFVLQYRVCLHVCPHKSDPIEALKHIDVQFVSIEPPRTSLHEDVAHALIPVEQWRREKQKK